MCFYLSLAAERFCRSVAAAVQHEAKQQCFTTEEEEVKGNKVRVHTVRTKQEVTTADSVLVGCLCE